MSGAHPTQERQASGDQEGISPALAVAGHALRQALRGRRLVGLGLLVVAPAALLMLGVLFEGAEALAPEATSPILFAVGLTVVVPLVTLFLGVSAFREDLEEGTLVHLVTRPVPKEVLVGARWLGASAAGLVLSALALLLPSLLLGAPALERLPGALLTAALAVPTYTALFLLAGLATRRAVLLGLVYLLAWEGVVASTGLFFRVATVAFWLRSLVVEWSLADQQVLGALVDRPVAEPWQALGVLAVITVAALVLAVWRLRTKEVPGPEPM